MSCQCSIDHWHHAAAGFQGIVAMLDRLKDSDVPVTEQAWHKIEEQTARLIELRDYIRKTREK